MKINGEVSIKSKTSPFCYLQHPQEPLGLNGVAQESFLAFGGKNSSRGKLIFLNASQGSSVSQEHSFVGMQKSYAGISICTSLSS